MATSKSPFACYILVVVTVTVAAASSDSSQGAAFRGAAAAVDLTEPRRVQEVQGGFQPVQGEGAVQGGAMQGGAMQGGAMQGGAVQGGAAQGGVVQGGAVQGGAMQGGAVQGGAEQGGDVTDQLPDIQVPDFLPDWMKNTFTTKGYLTRFVLLMIVGFFYWCCIVSKYPKLLGPSMTSARLQSENELNATCQASFVNCLYSYLCSQARAAHTFDSAGVCNYWPSLLLMTLCPCPTLYFMNSCSNLNEKLGGRKKDCCTGLICSFCCSCCVIAQDAESLDMATGARTQCCGVEQSPDFHHGMYPGGGMPPQHHMHHGHHGHHGHHQPQGGFMVNPQASYGYGQVHPMQQY